MLQGRSAETTFLKSNLANRQQVTNEINCETGETEKWPLCRSMPRPGGKRELFKTIQGKVVCSLQPKLLQDTLRLLLKLSVMKDKSCVSFIFIFPSQLLTNPIRKTI